MCDLVEQEFYAGENWFEWISRHRVARTCVECELPIPAGEKHVVVFHGPYEHELVVLHGPYEHKRTGPWHRFFVHRACDKLRDLAAEVVCGDSAAYGEMIEHVEWCEVALLYRAIDPDDELAVERFHEEWSDFFDYDVDEDRAEEVVRRWDAIEHRYDGVERDLGGEG